ncbi:MAG: Hpt domain-containing protein [Lentisphaeraceae bacterium]|nr:Hpt domain-containing protein [Lentisphaeraceae bacterium]
MEFRLKVLLSVDSHISETLTQMKLKNFGHTVELESDLTHITDDLKSSHYDVVLLDAVNDQKLALGPEILAHKVPVLYVYTAGEVACKSASDVTITPSFSEEDFLHKFHLVENEISKRQKPEQSFEEKVLSHYSGDKELLHKVCKSFLSAYIASLESIREGFESDSDKELSRKVHSFKGVLSALGETPAAKLIKQMEILVKGRQKKVAQTLLPKLDKECQFLATQVSGIL